MERPAKILALQISLGPRVNFSKLSPDSTKLGENTGKEYTIICATRKGAELAPMMQ